MAVAPFGDGAGYLVDFETGLGVRLAGHRDDVSAMAFAPDERLVASGSVDGTLRLWTVPDGRWVGTLPGHLESVEGVAFSADGRTLASVTVGVDVAFWHVATRRELARLPHPESGAWLGFTADGLRLLLGASAGQMDTSTDRLEIWEAPRDGEGWVPVRQGGLRVSGGIRDR